MKKVRVQELIYVVPEQREAFLQKHLNPSQEAREIFWTHGIRNQFYYRLNEFILMSFEYVGNDFYGDMKAIGGYPEMKKYLVRRRRKEIPGDQLSTVNWWAPLQKIGEGSVVNPFPAEDELSMEEQYHEMISGYMENHEVISDVAFDDDDWSESVHI